MIGILTFHRGPNHGGYLQAYELSKAVDSLGFESQIINYQNPHHFHGERFRPWIYRRPSKLWHAYRKFSAFFKASRQLPMGEFTTDSEQIDWSKYTTVLVGADVVWDYSQKRLGRDPIYFGGFRDKFDGVLASYAPSCGMANPSEVIPEWVKGGLQGFDHLAARDETTQTLVRSAIDVEVPIVADPTWLPLHRASPSRVASPLNTKSAYIAVYGFSINKESAREVLKYARKRGLRVYASGYTQAWADKNFSSLDPFEWVEFLRNADCVFAGTFHGALYAMGLGKRFAILPNEHIQAKLATPLNLAGLEHHILQTPIDIEGNLDLPVNFDQTLMSLKPFAEKSWGYLERVLA